MSLEDEDTEGLTISFVCKTLFIRGITVYNFYCFFPLKRSHGNFATDTVLLPSNPEHNLTLVSAMGTSCTTYVGNGTTFRGRKDQENVTIRPSSLFLTTDRSVKGYLNNRHYSQM